MVDEFCGQNSRGKDGCKVTEVGFEEKVKFRNQILVIVYEYY